MDTETSGQVAPPTHFPDPQHYPIIGRASIIACPVHGCAVPLGPDGRVAGPCPECAAVSK